MVDEVIAYLAPALLGAGRGAVGDLGIDTIVDAVRLTISEVTLVGGDLRISATRATRADGEE
jgi:diaminohydroxyphosphoribosylaminopyrimidine deaminase/5-amino-6-(5-phosphoribosylamino)uracil reductase